MVHEQELDLERPAEGQALEAQIQWRIFAQLRRPLRMLHTIRVFGVLVIGLVVLAAAGSAGAPVPVTALGALLLTVVVVALYRRLHITEIDISPAGLRFTFISLVTLQTLAVAVTGGLQSPLIVVFIPGMILSAVVSGRVRTMGPAFALVLLAMVAFWVCDTFAAGALPALDVRWSRVLLGIAVMVACGMGARVGLVIRSAFEESVRTEALARASSVDMLRARNRELKELGSSLAHELKNPLAAIQGLTMQQLRNAPEGSRDAERLAVVVGEVKRMSKVLDDFLTFARPFADVEKEDADLGEVVRNVLSMYREHVDALGIVVEISGEEAVEVPCDVRQIGHVLVNLLLNALDASKPGSRLVLELRQTSEVAVLELHDEGAGLSTDALERAFDAGFTTRSEGTGLGLAISRGIVNAHGGSLTLRNRAEGGCTATMQLPLKEMA